MKNLEFYIYEDELWCLYPDGTNDRVTERSTVLVKETLDIIRECYSDAYKALMECYQKSSSNIPYFQFLMVNRFCKCNFGNLDSTKRDIDAFGRFNFERVGCPMRGECKYENIICNPKFNSKLSEAELRVIRLVHDGYSNEEIADKIYLSPHTVKNHIKSVYLKLGIHEKAEFVKYANSNNLFNS